MIKRAPGSSRKAILTQSDKDYLRGKKPISKKYRSKLFRELNDRFEALLKDLEIINRSRLLENWRVFLAQRHFFRDGEVLSRILTPIRTAHLSVIRHVRKHKKHYFWLDVKPNNQKEFRIDERAFKEDFVLRELNSSIKKKLGGVLIRAYQNSKLPHVESEAIDVSKIHEHFEKNTTPHIKKISLDQLKQEDPVQGQRFKEIEKILEKYRKKADKELAPYNSKIIQIQPRLD